MGYLPKVGAEFEFFRCFKETPESLRQKSFANLTPLSPGQKPLLVGALERERGVGERGPWSGLPRTSTFLSRACTPRARPAVYECAILYDDVRRAAEQGRALQDRHRKILLQAQS